MKVEIGNATLYLGDCREILPTLPKVDAVITDLAAGAAGEHLVCADLLLQGYRAFLSDQNCPYDVAVDVGGQAAPNAKANRPNGVVHQAGWRPRDHS